MKYLKIMRKIRINIGNNEKDEVKDQMKIRERDEYKEDKD